MTLVLPLLLDLNSIEQKIVRDSSTTLGMTGERFTSTSLIMRLR